MGSTFKVEAEVNVRGQGRLDSRPAEIVKGRTTTWADNYVNTDERYERDDDGALKEVFLFHCKEIFMK